MCWRKLQDSKPRAGVRPAGLLSKQRHLTTLPIFQNVVPQVGLEPTCPKALASEASASTNFTTGAENNAGAQGGSRIPNICSLNAARLPIAPLEQKSYGVPSRGRTGSAISGHGF